MTPQQKQVNSCLATILLVLPSHAVGFEDECNTFITLRCGCSLHQRHLVPEMAAPCNRVFTTCALFPQVLDFEQEVFSSMGVSR